MTLEAGLRAAANAIVVLCVGWQMDASSVVFLGTTMVQATLVWILLFFFLIVALLLGLLLIREGRGAIPCDGWAYIFYRALVLG